MHHGPRALVRLLALVLLVALAACQGRSSESERRPASDPAVTTPRHPDPGGAVARCRARFEAALAEGLAPDARDIAAGCAELFVEARCREAWAKAAATPPDARAATLATACRDAYCPHVPAPRPALCERAELPPPSALAPAFAELTRAALRLDLGVEQGELLLSGVLVEAARTASRRGTPAAPPAKLVITVGPTALTLAGADGQALVTVPRGPGDHQAFGTRLGALVAERWPDRTARPPAVVLSVPPETPYAEVVALMDTIRPHFPDLALDPTGGAADAGPAPPSPAAPGR